MKTITELAEVNEMEGEDLLHSFIKNGVLSKDHKLTRLGLDWAGECKKGVIRFPDNVLCEMGLCRCRF